MKKVLKNLKVNEWLKRGHMSSFFMGKGQCLPYWQIALLEKKKSQTFDFFWFWAPATEEERKCQRSKRRINAEEWRRKEKLENAEGVKIRFVLFISFLFCGLSVFQECIFGFVVRMRDKKTKFNKENGTTLLLFLLFSSFGLTRETRPQFSNPSCLTAVRTVHCAFCVQQVLGLKEPFQGQFPVNRVGPYGPVLISKPWDQF